MLRSSYPVFKTKIIKVTSTQRARSSNDTSACTLSTWMPSFMEVIYMRSENFMTVPRLWAKTTPRESQPSGWSPPDLTLQPPLLLVLKDRSRWVCSRLTEVDTIEDNQTKKICQLKRESLQSSSSFRRLGIITWGSVSERCDILSAFTALLLYGLKQLHGPIRAAARHWD